MIKNIIEVPSIELPFLQPYRTLKRQQEHRDEGIFVAEGEKVVLRLLSSGIPVVSILTCSTILEKYKDIFKKNNSAIEIYLATPEMLKEITGFNMHQGTMAIGLVPTPPKIESLILRYPERCFFVAIDNVISAENLGVLVRNCAALGVQGLIVGESSADPYLRRSVRNSMGTIFSLPIIYSENLRELLQNLEENFGFTNVATYLNDQSKPIWEFDLRKNSCIVFGNEDKGVSPEIVNVCSKKALIPMAENIDSMNIANAAAAVLYEVLRQRKS